MATKVFGEFIGTAVLILLGNGVVAGVLLKRSKAEGAGWVAITAGWAFAVVFGVFLAIACGSPDAILNPAVTLGVAISSGDFSIDCGDMAGYLLGRLGHPPWVLALSFSVRGFRISPPRHKIGSTLNMTHLA